MVQGAGSGMVERDRMVKREVSPIVLRGERVVIDLTGGDD